MKTAASSLFTLAFASYAAAYPSILAHLEAQAANGGQAKRQLISPPPFDAAAQYVSNKGQYAFVPPGSGDQRGPCPGLNAMANHNYMPHNGIGTIQQFIDGTNKVFGMGEDLGGFLAVYGAVADGNALEWSIGGPTPGVGSILGLTGTPQGISGSHNKYESDVSPTRGDLYEYGNDYLLQVKQFQQLYDLGKAEDNYDLDILTDFRATRFQQSIDNNPYFFNGVFSGVLVQPAAYTFIYRFMANKSAEYPEGKLDGEVLKTFFSITGEDGNFTYTPGYERIPDNWYTRNVVDDYTIPYFLVDLLAAAVAHPEFLSVGGNTGTVDSFTGVDLADLTGGVYNAQTLAQGNNAACFAMQAAVQSLPDFITGLLTDVTAMDLLGSALNNATDSLGCPKLNNIDKNQFNKYPGYTKLNDASGTYRK
ncbi:hypothetical protein MBLNU459_g0307t1 [Dothideomycetes sp. NU459]